jgi:hypothetical protein
MNGISTRSIIRLKSSPVMVRVDLPTSLLGVSSWRVTTPSISTLAMPFRVTMMITRVMIGSKYPAGISVCSSDVLPILNDS